MALREMKRLNVPLDSPPTAASSRDHGAIPQGFDYDPAARSTFFLEPSA